MAQSPEANETFLREVEEELSYDRIVGFFRDRWQRVALAIGGLLAMLAGGLGWQAHLSAQAEAQQEQMSSALEDVRAGNLAGLPAKLAPLAASGNEGYRASAKLLDAALVAKRGDTKAAIAQFQAIANDTSLGPTWRDAARLRQTMLEYDTLAPEVIVARLQPLAVKGQPWFGTAGEMLGMAYIKQNKLDEAGKLFASIATDKDVPKTIAERTRQMATALGQDVPLPAKDDLQ